MAGAIQQLSRSLSTEWAEGQRTNKQMEGGVGALANKTHKLTVDTGVEINKEKATTNMWKNLCCLLYSVQTELFKN